MLEPIFSFIIMLLIALIVIIIIFSTVKTKNNDKANIKSIPKEEFRNDGEKNVASLLYKIADIFGGKVINNVIITDSYGNSSEIDHILFLKSGVYVIETKDSAGDIYGKIDDNKWHQVLGNNNIINELYNPIKQNDSHVKKVCYYLKEYDYVYSCVIFTKANIKNVNIEGVYTIESFCKLIKDNSNYKFLTNQEIERYYHLINKFKTNPKVTKKEHVKKIKNKKPD